MRTILTTILISGLAATGVLSGCDDNDEVEVRFVHAAPGAPPVDVYIAGNSAPLFVGLSYGEATAFVNVPVGEDRLEVVVAGTNDVVLVAGPLGAVDDDRVTLVATGYVTSTDPANSFRVIPLFEDFDDPDNDEAAIRVVHASPDAPTIDVDFDDDAAIDISGLERFAATDEAGLAIPSDTERQVAIYANGQRATAFSLPGLADDEEALVIAIGNVTSLPRDPLGFSLLVVGPEGVIISVLQNPTVVALHASPDAPAVDIRLGPTGPNLIADLGFGELGFVQVPPGSYPLSFFAAGDPGTSPVLTSNVGPLVAGERYLAIATGMLTPASGEQAFQLLPYLEQFTVDGQPRVRSIHASPDAPAVDLSTAVGTALTRPVLVSDLMFGEATEAEGTPVAASSSVRVGIAVANSLTAVATFTLSTLGAPREFLIVAGAATPASGERSLRLFQIDTARYPWTIATVLPN